MKKVFIVGSINMDLVIASDRLPLMGETIHGRDFFTNPGGKGANQAVAVQKSGGDARFCACVGNDDFGDILIGGLKACGVDTRFVTREDAPSGVAVITVVNGDNCIVLGAGVNGSTPSLSMCNRLDAALDYLGANPDALAVVSGGQGEDEDITEAEAMADYLTAHGIDSARIVQEDQSRTTRENLENSFAILRARGYAPADGVGIVTSEYHLCRAKRMARALGAEPVGIAAETTLPSMRINYFIREAFAAAYMQLAGTLY